MIYPRSSISNKDLFLANSVGIIDSGYRGEIEVRFRKPINMVDEEPVLTKCLDLNSNNVENRSVNYGGVVQDNPNDFYQVGDRIAQLIIMPYPRVEFVETESLNFDHNRGGGFGSTNDK